MDDVCLRHHTLARYHSVMFHVTYIQLEHAFTCLFTGDITSQNKNKKRYT